MIKNIEDAQKMNQAGIDGAMKAWGDWTKGLQAIAAEMTDYSKRSYEDSSQTFEKLLSVKSPDQAVEIQTGYAKRAYEDYMRQMNKIGTMYTDFAKEAYKPVERAFQQGR
jgi:hypothetical protein